MTRLSSTPSLSTTVSGYWEGTRLTQIKETYCALKDQQEVSLTRAMTGTVLGRPKVMRSRSRHQRLAILLGTNFNLGNNKHCPTRSIALKRGSFVGSY